MRVLTISSPYGSHFLPLVPLLRALGAAGHDLVLLGQPDVTDIARPAGLDTVVIGGRYTSSTKFPSLPPGKRPIEAGVGQVPEGGWASASAAPGYVPWIDHSSDMLEPYLEFARGWRPDLILTDPLEFSGLIVGGVLGVPAVHHRWGSEPMTPAALGIARQLLHRHALRFGLPRVPDPALVLVPAPRSWALAEFPGDRLVRPVPYNGEAPVPCWTADPPGMRRVCVSLGWTTLVLNGLPLLRSIVDAVGGLAGVEAVVTVGREDRDRLGPVPESVRLVDPAPVSALLRHSDVMCHHGGAGTAIAALAAGVPQLLLPQLTDQHPRCARIAASGAGIALSTAREQNDPAVVRAALLRLLDRPRYREAAFAVRAEADTLPAPEEVAEVLRELADQRMTGL